VTANRGPSQEAYRLTKRLYTSQISIVDEHPLQTCDAVSTAIATDVSINLPCPAEWERASSEARCDGEPAED
jgi:hypothetical protein